MLASGISRKRYMRARGQKYDYTERPRQLRSLSASHPACSAITTPGQQPRHNSGSVVGVRAQYTHLPPSGSGRRHG